MSRKKQTRNDGCKQRGPSRLLATTAEMSGDIGLLHSWGTRRQDNIPTYHCGLGGRVLASAGTQAVSV